MPLFTCPDCGAQVSTQAPACPKCGRPSGSQTFATAAPAPQSKRTGATIPLWFWFALGAIALVLVTALTVIAGSSKHEEDAKTAASRSAAYEATEAAAAKKTAADVAAARDAAEERDRAALSALTAQLTAKTPDERERKIRACAGTEACKQPQMDAIIASGADEKERGHLEIVSFAAAAEKFAKAGQDGTSMTPAPVGAVGVILMQHGKAVLDAMPKTSAAEAQKDSDGSRGKVVRVGGSVIEIRKDKEIYEGTIAIDGGGYAYFITPLPTPGVFAGSWASYRGIYIQEYAYPNVSGGQTRSLLLVGAFN